ncbi:FAD/FMN-containing dehydrogenase [Chromohalobacter marismortui]|uniref:FAD/FMN-containing dehydrogenase n=1 Tax=Chromohalobacter marismortui TaxID=42055 RepID=A0A4R7NVX6_9GAMM|nr:MULTISPECIES: FAD-binding oxidoreductase [Chromohalobacter]MCI0511173.1 FAD-binding oxidoreductase [Chromohalobacter sp.]MCI0593591.1 FAD-binding oxidoreductase [Chromohalobacter sp.]TDU25198.1 FAD/FMN-containing dehydrogenase [Chromohalobacter marismortui]
MPIDTAALHRFLTELLGTGGVIDDPAAFARYTTDWAGDKGGDPWMIARPATPEQVADIVAFCHRHQIPMVAQGGHSGLVGGAQPDPERGELMISLERLNRIRHLDPVNFSMSVDSGCILQTVKEAAEEADCYFPLALGAQGSCQIGGNVSTNAGGLNVLRYGMMRQLVLGLEVVLPDGRLWNGMHALHKDNRGYDLKQLFIGAEGTLGIVTGAVLKLAPRPQTSRTALIAVPDIAAALALYGQARRSCCDLLSAFELIPRVCMELAFEAAPDLPDPFDDAHPVYVLMEVSASGPADLDTMIEHLFETGAEQEHVLDGVLASSETQAAQLWQIRESMLEGQQMRGEHLRTDVSLPISGLTAFFEDASHAVTQRSPDTQIIAYGHIGDGNLHFNLLPPARLDLEAKKALLHELEDALFDIVDAHHGSISAEHGIGRVKQAAFLADLSDTEYTLLKGLKQLFDPQGLMAAGRILPR